MNRFGDLNIDEKGRPYGRPSLSEPSAGNSTFNDEVLTLLRQWLSPRSSFNGGHATLMSGKPQRIRDRTSGRRSFVLQNLGNGASPVAGNVYVNKDQNVSATNGQLLLVSGVFQLSLNESEIWCVSDTDNVIVSWSED